MVISRSTKTPLAYIAHNKRRYYIDSDFINYLSPVLFGDKVRYILGGRNLVKHTIFYDFYNRDISKQPLEFILLPKVLLDRNVSIKELVDTYGPDRVVARLVTAASSPEAKNQSTGRFVLVNSWNLKVSCCQGSPLAAFVFEIYQKRPRG